MKQEGSAARQQHTVAQKDAAPTGALFLPFFVSFVPGAAGRPRQHDARPVRAGHIPGAGAPLPPDGSALICRERGPAKARATWRGRTGCGITARSRGNKTAWGVVTSPQCGESRKKKEDNSTLAGVVVEDEGVAHPTQLSHDDALATLQAAEALGIDPTLDAEPPAPECTPTNSVATYDANTPQVRFDVLCGRAGMTGEAPRRGCIELSPPLPLARCAWAAGCPTPSPATRPCTPMARTRAADGRGSPNRCCTCLPTLLSRASGTADEGRPGLLPRAVVRQRSH